MSQSVLVCLNCGRSYDFRQLDAAIRLPLRDGKSEVFSELMDHVLSGLGFELVCKDCDYPWEPSMWLWCNDVHPNGADLTPLRIKHDTLTRERDRARETSAQSPPDSAPHRLIGWASDSARTTSKP